MLSGRLLEGLRRDQAAQHKARDRGKRAHRNVRQGVEIHVDAKAEAIGEAAALVDTVYFIGTRKAEFRQGRRVIERGPNAPNREDVRC